MKIIFNIWLLRKRETPMGGNLVEEQTVWLRRVIKVKENEKMKEREKKGDEYE
jgi:hypothetical protein